MFECEFKTYPHIFQLNSLGSGISQRLEGPEREDVNFAFMFACFLDHKFTPESNVKRFLPLLPFLTQPILPIGSLILLESCSKVLVSAALAIKR